MCRKKVKTRVAASVAVACAMHVAAQKPNIVFILADDLGYGDVGFTGGTVNTPSIDRLAAEGMRLGGFYANGPVCTPTRASIMTGKYPQRYGLAQVLFVSNDDHRRSGLPPGEYTLAKALKEQGYATALLGKWHLGGIPGSKPNDLGFDWFVGNLQGHVDYVSKWNRIEPDWHHNRELVDEPGYATHLLNDHAVRFIEQNRDRPFFIFLSHPCPHDPHQLPGDPHMYGPGGVRHVPFTPAKHYPMIEEMDKGIGDILAKIEELGLDRNTLVVFTSDNGHHAASGGSAGPYRGSKSFLYEGGVRVPFAARWPGVIAPGSVSGVPLMTMDLMPTFMQLAGGVAPAAIDGVSFSGVLKEGASLPPRPLYWEMNGRKAMREGDWKLLLLPERGSREVAVELYHLATDPSESTNLAAQEPERTARMRSSLEAWLADVQEGAVRQPLVSRQ